MNEDAFLEELRRRYPSREPLGIGDDCCVWSGTGTECLSTDSQVEGLHFRPVDDDAVVGGKAALAALSDLAAMGAGPIGATLALQVGPGRGAAKLVAGCADALAAHGCPLLGGDTTGAPCTVLTVTIWGGPGPAGRLLYRDGGVAGATLAVTGALGGSLAGGRHLHPFPRLAEGAWLAGRAEALALLDLSDGLATDGPRLARASGCGLELDAEAVPVHADARVAEDPLGAALTDGEDFELLVAVEPAAWEALHAAWPFALPLTRVGRLVAGPGSWLRMQGERRSSPYDGYQHEI